MVRFGAAAVFFGALAAYAVFAQKHEVGLTLGGIVSRDRTAKDGTKLSLDSGTALQANYGYRLCGGEKAALFVGVHFLANGSRSVNSIDNEVPRSAASLYVTPDVIVKFAPHAKIQPWAAIGGGYAQYESSKELQDGSANPGKIRIHRGAFVYGGGADVPVRNWMALRGEIRDFYTGGPSLHVPLSGGQHNAVAGGGFVLRFGN